MVNNTSVDILLSGFSDADAEALRAAAGALGRSASRGDPVNDDKATFVLAAAYDESGLRSLRAAASEDRRPWCFCVPSGDRSLIAAACFAREGRVLLMPPEGRELRRTLSALDEEAKERSSGAHAFAGLDKLEAEFSWKTSVFDVSRVCRRLAGLLAEAGFYPDRSSEDECALALEEALVNSTEHGNLGLDSALRPDDPLQEDRYELERSKRMADPAYGDKLVRISLAMDRDQATMVLEDEGEGFDVSRIDMEPSGLDVSGKGFWLIRRPFDSAAYNPKGNRLTLSRRRPKA